MDDEMDELFAVVTRIDERTATMEPRVARIEQGMFFGDGSEPLITQVARHDEQIKAVRNEIKRESRLSGARWGAAVASIVSAIVAGAVGAITGRQ